MATFKALPRGAQIVLLAGPLLFSSLFLTWQQVEVDYGRAGVAKLPLDGWDAWGLLLGLSTIAAVALVALFHLTDVEMSEDVPWETIVLGIGAAIAGVAVLKSLTDAGSTYVSYVFVALAVAIAAGACLDWAEARRPAQPVLSGKRRGFRPAA